MTETTYEEYRAAIAAQTQRDRERFTGIDSHPEAPMYAAETGLRLNTWSFQEPSVSEEADGFFYEWVHSGTMFDPSRFTIITTPLTIGATWFEKFYPVDDEQ